MKLGNDVSNCPANGLNVGADNIVIDLNGHTVSSPGAFFGGVYGIDFAGHSGVNLRNGTVKGFETGLHVIGNSNRVQHVTVRDSWNRLGIVVQGNHNTVTSTHITNNDNGGIEVSGNANTFTYNFVDHTQDAFDVLFGSANVVANNTIQAPGGCCSRGIELAFESSDTVEHNKVTGAADIGVRLFCLNNTDLIHANVVSGGRVGFEVEDSSGCHGSGSNGVRLVANRATDNIEAGFRLGGNDAPFGDDLYRNISQANDIGFDLHGTTNAVLRDNVAGSVSSLSGGAPGNNRGIVVGDQSTGTQLLRNGANNNLAGDGILIDSSTSNTTLLGNVANRNAANGIEDQSGSAIFTSNIANYNHLFGILAAPGVTDGGGNHASHNGAGQCTNVSC